jgi:putative flavoprotein involved in K+ transport
MTDRIGVVVIGAGQAGLAVSRELGRAGVDHIVLEKGRVAQTWRGRWDSFCLVTPNWSAQLPGYRYDGQDPDGFMPGDEVVAFLERYATGFQAPVREDVEVTSLEPGQEGRFGLETSVGEMTAETVVLCTGAYQRPHRPTAAVTLPANLLQIDVEDYRNPAQLPPGPVLVVGSGQSGCQIAEELHQSGRQVFLACGRAPWAPRRLGDHDLVWWIAETGLFDAPLSSLPSPAARLTANIQATGSGGGHDLHYRTLHAMGVELLGHYLGADDRKIHFAGDLPQSIEAGDNLARTFMKWVAELCEKRGLEVPWEVPAPPGFTSRAELDIDREGITSVIWTTGFRPDYGWVHAPVFDDMGFPVQTDGRSDVARLYFMGVHFQRKAQSAVLYGVGEDAEVVARHIVESRG